MGKTLLSLSALFAATLLLTTGIGLLSTFLSLRMTLEGFDSQLIGLVMASYYIGLMLGGVLCQRVIRRVGHIRAFAVFAALNTATILWQALYITPWAWWGLRFLTGFTMMGLYMVLESWLNERTEPRLRGRVFSVYMAASFLGLGGGQFLLNVSPVEGPNLFFVVAIFVVLSLLPVTLTRTPHPQIPASHGFSLRKLARLAPFGVLGCFNAGIANGSFYALGPSFALQIGLAPAAVSWFMSLTIFSGLLMQWPVGLLSDRFDRRTVLALLSLTLMLACLGVMLSARYALGLLLPVTVLYGGLMCSLYPVAVAHTHDHVAPQDIVGVSSMLLLLYGLGASLGPIVGAQLMALFGPYGVYLLVGAVSGLLGLVTFARRRAERVPVEQQTECVAVPRTSPVINTLDPRAGHAVRAASTLETSEGDAVRSA